MSKRFTNAWLIVACATCAGASYGADISTEPRADLRIEQNDNFDLVPGGSPESDVYGYVADLGALFDIKTPRGGTELLPRIKLQEFPDRQDLERVEWFLNMHSDYRSERNRFFFDGNASRQDLYNSETPSGGDPGGGDNGDSGQIVIGEVRTWMSLKPTLEHQFTERTSAGIGAQFQGARYYADAGTETKIDYNYSVVNAYLSWALNPTTDLSVGAYGSSYEAQDNSEDTDAIGGGVGIVHRWNTTDGIEATLYYERNDITEFVPVLNKETTTGVGGELTAYRKLEVSEWRFTIGRSFIPTGDSGKASLDQVSGQYERSLSQRLSLKVAARYDSRNALGTTTITTGDDRDYARADLSLKWFVAPTWYIGGGYAYIWEDRQQAVSDASNNKFYINFGYRALSRGDIEPPNWDQP